MIESVKAASDILAPVDGEIVAVNDKLVDAPGAGERRPDRGGLVLQDEGR